jgi:hypothetical protein
MTDDHIQQMKDSGFPWLVEAAEQWERERKWAAELERAIKEAQFGLMIVSHPQHQRAKKELNEALAKKKQILGD